MPERKECLNASRSNCSRASVNFLFQRAALQIEFARRCALKRKDRLFLVADREDGALDAVARAFAGGEFGDDVCDDIPLPRAGVLRLVDQHMIDAAVELEVYPAGGDAVQHLQRPVDQVVIIEQPAFLFFAAVVRGDRGCDDKQGLRPVADRQRAAPVDQRADTVGLALEQACLSRDCLSQNFFVTTDLRGAQCLGQEHTEIGIDLFATGKGQRFAEPSRLVGIGLAPRIEDCGYVLPSCSRQMRPIDDLALDIVKPLVLDRRRARRTPAPSRHWRCRRCRSTP